MSEEDRSLSSDELDYHNRVVESLKIAQSVWISWSNHIAQKYELTENEFVDESGRIQVSA